MALCHGDSRLLLTKESKRNQGCHGLVPWRLTLDFIVLNIGLPLTHANCSGERESPRHQAVASIRSSLPVFVAASVNLHGTRPWHQFGLVACFVAASVNLHGTRPWHRFGLVACFVAASVNLHGTRPWHRFGLVACFVAASV